MLLLIQNFSQIKIKIAEVRHLFKQGDKMPKITHQYPFYRFFQNFREVDVQ
jgi:hypothetical protein